MTGGSEGWMWTKPTGRRGVCWKQGIGEVSAEVEDSGDVWGKKWEGVSRGMRGAVGQLRGQEWVRSGGGCR